MQTIDLLQTILFLFSVCRCSASRPTSCVTRPPFHMYLVPTIPNSIDACFGGLIPAREYVLEFRCQSEFTPNVNEPELLSTLQYSLDDSNVWRSVGSSALIVARADLLMTRLRSLPEASIAMAPDSKAVVQRQIHCQIHIHESAEGGSSGSWMEPILYLLLIAAMFLVPYAAKLRGVLPFKVKLR